MNIQKKLFLLTLFALSCNVPMHGMWNTIKTRTAQAATKAANYMRMQRPKLHQTFAHQAPVRNRGLLKYGAALIGAGLITASLAHTAAHAQGAPANVSIGEQSNRCNKEDIAIAAHIVTAKSLILKKDVVSIAATRALINASCQVAIALTPYASAQLHHIAPEILQAILQQNPDAASEFVKYFAVANCNKTTQEKQAAVLKGLLDIYLSKKMQKEEQTQISDCTKTNNYPNLQWTNNTTTISFDEYLFDAFEQNPALISSSFHAMIIEHCSKINSPTAQHFLHIIAKHKLPNGTIMPYCPKKYGKKTMYIARYIACDNDEAYNLGGYGIHYFPQDYAIYILISDSRDVAGYVMISLGSNHIQYLFVDSNYRRKHYGQKLMTQAIMHCRQNETADQFQEITLYSKENKAPQALYEKLGFTSFDKKRYTLE